MDCPACGADNREGARFCRRCGADMISLPPETAAGRAPGESTLGEELNLTPEVPTEGAQTETSAQVESALEAEEGMAQEGAGTGMAGEEPAALEEVEVAAEPEAEGVPETPGERDREEAVGEGVGAEGVAPEAGEPALPLVEVADEAHLRGEPPAPVGEQPLEEEQEADDGDVDLLGFWREEREPLQPVEVGTLVADRYQVVEALDLQKETILYLAHDLDRCWQCGFEGNAREDAFCAKCGAAQDLKPDVRLRQVRDGEVGQPQGEGVDETLVHEGRTFLLLAEQEPEPPQQEIQVWGIRLLVGQRSDAGQVRDLNEDSMLTLTLTPSYEGRIGPALGLFSVADGMGGHEGGEIASKMSLQVLAAQAMRHIFMPVMAGELVLDEDVTALLRQATIAANDAVYLARQKRENDMGTTLTAALVRDERLFLAHVGDCRAYRWNAQGLQHLTTDHSVVASMIAEGRATPEEIYNHPHRSVIYRCIGDKPTVEVDTDMLPLGPGDRIILCSDGLWEMVRDEGIEDVMMQETDSQAACDLLVKHANLAGGEDNVSVIVIQVETT